MISNSDPAKPVCHLAKSLAKAAIFTLTLE